MRGMTLTLTISGAIAALAAAGPGAAQPPAPLRDSEFVALGGGGNFIAFASPQLVSRQGPRTTATMVMVPDHTQSNGATNIAVTQYITCADGQSQIVAQIMRDPAGKEVAHQTPTASAQKPDPETVQGKFVNWVCTGKLPDPQAARYPTIEQAIDGAREILARNAKAAAP